jgi:hypothetical protein
MTNSDFIKLFRHAITISVKDLLESPHPFDNYPQQYRMSDKSVASEHRIIFGYYRYHALKDQMREPMISKA